MAVLDKALASKGQPGGAVPCGGNGWTMFSTKAACDDAVARIANAGGGSWECNTCDACSGTVDNCGGKGCRGQYHITGCTKGKLALINKVLMGFP